MSEDAFAQLGLSTRLLIVARLAVALVMWTRIAFEISAGKALAGVPAATPEWNKTWENYQRWALDLAHFTPIQELKLLCTLPAALFVYSGFPMRMLTNPLPLIALWSPGCDPIPR